MGDEESRKRSDGFLEARPFLYKDPRVNFYHPNKEMRV